MITGELKNKVDKIWEIFWTGGITNPLEVIEQFNYLLFIKQLDEVDTKEFHDDLTEDYAEIPAEMKKVAAFFKKKVLREVDEKEFFQQIVSSIVGVNLRIWEMRMRFMI